MAEDTMTDGLLDRIQLLAVKPGENAELIRSIGAKLLTKASSPDVNVRQPTLDKLCSNNCAHLVTMASLLETCRDVGVCSNLAAIIREAVCLKPAKVSRKPAQKKSSTDINEDVVPNIALKSRSLSKQVITSSVDLTSKDSITKKANNSARLLAVAQLVKQNVTAVVIRSLLQIHARREPNNMHIESLLYDTLWILSQLAPKDPKFALKLRTYGAVKMVHNLLKIHVTNNKVVFPLLTIMKQIAKTPCSLSILVRDDVVTTYEKVLMALGHAPTVRLKLGLDTVDYLSRNKVCCIQMVKAGVVIVLLRIFDRWEKYEGKMRFKLVSRILQTLQHVCITKTGRRTLATKKHIQVLYKFCINCPDEENYDRLITKISLIICHCLNSRSLPVPAKNPAMFDLSNIISEEWPITEPDEDFEFLGSSSDEEDALEEDDANNEQSDSEIENGPKIPEDQQTNINCSFLFQSSERDIEDLKRYNPFFKEFSTLQKQLRLIKGSSKECLPDSPANPLSLSDFSVNRSKYSYSLKSALGHSSPSILFDVKTKTQMNMQFHSPKLNKTDSLGNLQCNVKIFQDLDTLNTVDEVYLNIASRVRSIIPFVKVAFPDLKGGNSRGIPELQHVPDGYTCRKKLINTIERAINTELMMNEVVYSLDNVSQSEPCATDRLLTNTDTHRISFNSFPVKKLEFESRFESGNLRKAIQIGPREYDLILMPDVNAKKRHLWFYFEISNMSNSASYTFNVVNCEKPDSQFNFGMKPVLYSVKEHLLGRPGWVRVGSDICYYRNSYQCLKSKTPLKCFLTATFTIDFPHSNDVCYIAYHFPYTYTQMMSKIWIWSQNLPRGTYFRVDTLCNTLNNNEIPLITITADDSPTNPIQNREIIFLTSRVHPGESNASWVMDGALGSLLSTTILSYKLRSSYIFKIIPMLNVEGVINGCYRCGLTNEDLNRRWIKPSPVLHPDIYHTKGLLEYMSHALRRPAAVYCDFHGHSRKKNVFLYGCSDAESWCKTDRDKAANEDRFKFMTLPVLMHKFCSNFSLPSCSFRVEREREATARVTVWRQLHVARSYTLEATFCGFDQGPFKGLQVITQHLQKVGQDLCAALDALNEDLPLDLKLLIEQSGGKYESSEGTSGDSTLSDSDEDPE